MSSVSYKKILISTAIIIIPVIFISIFILTLPPQLQVQERQSTKERSSQISTFGTREILSAENDNSSFPLITASDNNVYVVWLDRGAIEQSDVSLLASSDSRTKNLSNNTGESEFPQVAAAGDHVYVVWQDNATGGSDIYLKAGRDGGSKFRGLRNLSNNTGDSEFPQVAAAGDHVYVAWQDNATGGSDVYLKVGRDNGSKFRDPRNLSNNTGDSEFPQIAAAGDHVYVVWQDNATGGSDIYLKAGRDGGSKFRGLRNLSNNTGDSEFPQVAAAGDNMYVVWQDNATSGSDIYFKAGRDNGSKIARTKNLSNNTGDSEFPQIAAAGDHVYVVWQDNATGGSDVYLKAGSGPQVRGLRNLSNNTGDSEFPQVAAARDRVFVVWQDNASGDSDIYFKAGRDNGTKFSRTKNLSNNTGDSEFPQVAAAGDHVYVVWQDNTTGDNEIHLKRIRIAR